MCSGQPYDASRCKNTEESPSGVLRHVQSHCMVLSPRRPHESDSAKRLRVTNRGVCHRGQRRFKCSR